MPGTLLRLWLLACALLGLSPAWAQAPQPVPALTARVMDHSGTLSEPQRQALEAKLAAFEARSGPQIVVLLVNTTAPEDIAAFAYRVADHWKIGRRDVGDGLLLLVAKDDRRVRIEVARALEGAVPDLAARQIIDQAIAPAFKAGDYAGGLNQAVDRLIARISGEGLPTPAQAPVAPAASAAEDVPVWFWAVLVAVPVAMAVVRAVLGPLWGALLVGGVAGAAGAVWISLGAGLVLALVAGLATAIGVANLLQIVLSASSSGGGGGGGGGGFSSGGGGSFGGGGASGSW